MLTAHDASHKLHAHLFLDGIPPVIFIQERGVAADLPDPGELGEDLDPAVTKLFLGFSAEVFANFDHLGVVELLLLAFFAESRVVDLFELVRKIFENFRFGPSQDKGTDHSAESLHPFFILIFDDSSLKFLAEGAVVVQKSRHDEVKYTPELAQTVLDRCAGQCEPRLCLDELDALGGIRPVVLDVLGFVDKFVAEGPPLVLGNVPL